MNTIVRPSGGCNANPSVFHQPHIGRVTYEMMAAAFRPLSQTGTRPDWMESWMEPFARTTNAAKKYVVSSTLGRVDAQQGLELRLTTAAPSASVR